MVVLWFGARLVLAGRMTAGSLSAFVVDSGSGAAPPPPPRGAPALCLPGRGGEGRAPRLCAAHARHCGAAAPANNPA